MGQYYKIAIEREDSKQIEVYDRRIDGEREMAKLMEHSWYGNHMCNAIAKKIYNNPGRVSWVGDYAEESPLYNKVWGSRRKMFNSLRSSDFTLNDRFLVNHTKKEIIDCWEYVVRALKEGEDTWVIHPLPLLTAVGNGRGGGDFRGGVGEESVGRWAGDLLEVVDYPRYEELTKKKGYKKLDIVFIEKWR